jgi:TetR/AcrR family transcriptional regulator, transcriptional repressor for nem operon
LLKAKAAKALGKWLKNISQLIEAGIKAGEFKKDVNIRQSAVSVVALIEGGVMISRTTGDASSMDNVLATVEILISQMIK